MSVADYLFGEKCTKCEDRRTGNSDGICDQCQLEIEAEKEPKHNCLTCGTEMKKVIADEIIIDKCPKCNAVWLDGGELEKIKEKIADEHSDDGFGNGMMMGMILDPF